jgi:hypothetical protein
MALRRVLRNQASLTLIAALAAAGVSLAAQGTTFQFVLSATDQNGAPVGGLGPEDVIMSEDGEKQQIAKVEPLSVPIKLTIAVDNSAAIAAALDNFRDGLAGLVEALPPDVEVTLIVLAAQPRTVVKSTTDRTQLLKGIKSFGPEQGAPKFTDALMEFSQRLQREAKDRKAAPYLPVMVMVSTAANDQTTYQPKDIEQAVIFLQARRAKVNLVMVSTRPGDVKTATALSSTMQATVGRPATQMTNGRYEEVGVPTRLATLLPEWGKALGALHERQKTQFRVTVERKRSGNLQNPRFELARPGLNGAVTRDGYLP